MRILIAEDEVQLSRAVAAVLTHGGYEVDTAPDGKAALAYASEYVYDCMVFDIMMPQMDGIEALEKIRASGDTTPVILLTAKAEVEDRIGGLDAGADDYLTKPFSMRELEARIRSLTRRRENYAPKILKMGNITLDIEQQELKAVNAVRLAKKESELLAYLMVKRGKNLMPKEIFDHVWSDDPKVGIDVVWVYVSYLKNKLAAVSADVMLEGEKEGPYHLEEGEAGI